VGDLVKERIGAWAAGLFLVAFGLGMCLAQPWLWLAVAAAVAVWIRVNERRMQHAANPTDHPGDPLPYPTDLGPDDYVSADGMYVFRKRGGEVGYSIEHMEAPGNADTSRELAD